MKKETTAIKIKSLTKYYGKLKAVDNISLEIKKRGVSDSVKPWRTWRQINNKSAIINKTNKSILSCSISNFIYYYTG